MRTRTYRALAYTLLVASLLSSALSAERPYTVEDVLKVEGFGQVVVAPGGRWLLFERRTALADAFLFDQVSEDEVRNRLYRVDLSRPGVAEPLLPIDRHAGDTLLGFSPSGEQAAVGRFDGTHWTLGIVQIASGAVRWHDIAPDFSPFRTTLGWISEHRLLLIARPDGQLPQWLNAKRAEEANLARAWQTRAEGKEPLVTAVGSGRFLRATQRTDLMSLVSLDLSDGRAQTLAQGYFQNLTVAPDGRTAAVVSDEDAIRIRTPTPINQATETRRRRLLMVDLDTGRSWLPCAVCDLPYRMPVWSRSGRKLLFYSRDGDVGFENGHVWEADSRGAPAVPLTTDGLQMTVNHQRTVYDSVGLGWLDERPILFAHALRKMPGRSDWYIRDKDWRPLTRAVDMPSANLGTTIDGMTVMLGAQAWTLSEAGMRAITDTVASVAAVPSAASGVTPQVGHALLAQQRDVARIVARSGFPLKPIPLGPGDVRVVTASAEQQTVVGLSTDDHGVGALVLYRNGRTPLAVVTLNSFLGGVADRAPQRIAYQMGENSLTGWLYLPAVSSGRKPPLIVLPYASKVYSPDKPPSTGAPGLQDPTMNISVLRGRGYAVLLPSVPVPPASDNHPFDFATPVLAAVDAVIAQGLVDPDRLALWGHSLGGYTAAMTVTETNRFRAAIVSSGPYDFAGFIGSFGAGLQFDATEIATLQWSGYAETGPPHFLATPWGDPGCYVANSPVYRAGSIETPMLILASDRDFVPLQQGEQLFSTLYRQGKDAILLSYWGEEHGLTSPANIRDAYDRIFAWLDHHIGLP